MTGSKLYTLIRTRIRAKGYKWILDNSLWLQDLSSFEKYVLFLSYHCNGAEMARRLYVNRRTIVRTISRLRHWLDSLAECL